MYSVEYSVFSILLILVFYREVKISLRWDSNSKTSIPQIGTFGGLFNRSSGVLTSPLYPGKYPSDANCTYIISHPNGTFIINLEALSFDLYLDHTDTCLTYVEVRDGQSQQSPLIDRFCGTYITSPIKSSQNNLWLR